MEGGVGGAKFEPSVVLGEIGEGLAGECVYGAELYEAATIERMVGHWERLLEEMVGEGGKEKKVGELEMLSAREREQVLEEWNQTEEEFPTGSVQDMFEEQAERRAEAVAVVFGEESVSYGELNRRGNQVAHYLRGKGVKTESRVAICLERGLEMMVALLGVLKAGGAYVPLDPGYPQERLRFMLEDSDPVVLVTEGKLRGLFAGVGRAGLAGGA